MISIAFFNNKGGVGKTSLVYHTAWMFAELGYRVLAVDLDPQSNLSIMAVDEDRLEQLWPDDMHPHTLFGAVEPLFGGTGDVRPAHIERLGDRLGLIVGDLALSRIEDDLSTEWPRCLEGRDRAFRVTTAFWRVMKAAADAEVRGLEASKKANVASLNALKAGGMQILPPPAQLTADMKKVGETLLNEWLTKAGPEGQQLVDAFRK